MELISQMEEELYFLLSESNKTVSQNGGQCETVNFQTSVQISLI